jgi:hypothetical protein
MINLISCNSIVHIEHQSYHMLYREFNQHQTLNRCVCSVDAAAVIKYRFICVHVITYQRAGIMI